MLCAHHGPFLRLLRPHLESMGMRLSGARGDLSEASSSARKASGPPEKPSKPFLGLSVPVHNDIISCVRACHGNPLVLCEGGTRGARTAHGFVGVGYLGTSKPPRPPPPHCQAPSLRDSIGAQCLGHIRTHVLEETYESGASLERAYLH